MKQERQNEARYETVYSVERANDDAWDLASRRGTVYISQHLDRSAAEKVAKKFGAQVYHDQDLLSIEYIERLRRSDQLVLNGTHPRLS